jgi:hypothetical protein
MLMMSSKRKCVSSDIFNIDMLFSLFLILSTVILLFYFVSSQQTVHQQRHHARRIQQQARTRKIYAMCPPTFTKIGNECYHLSSSNESWLDSHFACKDKNAKLAEPLKYSDRTLRKYLLQHGKTRDDIWIGGMYNWQRNKWQWGEDNFLSFFMNKKLCSMYHSFHSTFILSVCRI